MAVLTDEDMNLAVTKGMIMGWFWKYVGKNSSRTVREICDGLSEAHTTPKQIRTVLPRMYREGMLARKRGVKPSQDRYLWVC